MPCPGSFTPRNDVVPIVLDAGWAPEPVWICAENLTPPPGFDPRTVQPIASRYTDCAIPAHYIIPMMPGNKIMISYVKNSCLAVT